MPSHKQQPTAAADLIPEKVEDPWAISESRLKQWILCPFEKQKAIVEDTRKKMIEDGISNELAANCTYWDVKPDEKRARDALRLAINEKSGKFNTVDQLLAAGQISDVQADYIREEHKTHGNGRVPPYFYIYQIHRVVDEADKSKSYLYAACMFEGLSVGQLKGDWRKYEGDHINHSFYIGFHNLPTLTPRVVKDSDEQEKRVLEFNWKYSNSWTGTRIYDIPWDINIFNKMLKHAFGSFEDGKVSLGIHRGNKHYGVKDLNDFVADDINAVIDRYEKPQPTYTFNISPEKLAKYIQLDEAAKEKDQYR